ncbi:hypothetical protein M501DRAFT_1013004 [Patellaria atrata CBS 101060]|uniref:DUF4045 domain-containing protein n=1 Tax=Patellaria atrata CBS 101060 TaxID=1346257 RepID=A0A9P4SJI2_9PEZI|nr:hypothetical protein M501DRAFT_1013004 [Patellaria atrata CBS 101060]
MSDNGIDPSEFVARIRELGEKRDEEDAERFRQLEEQINERRARRAERARSYSPEKASASSTPRSIRSPAEVEVTTNPTTTDAPEPTLTPLQNSLISSDIADEPVKPSKSPSVPPKRSGTLSWQQRPKSSAGRRPLSMVATENRAARSPRATPDPTANDELELSRDQIAQSLNAKDPTWFKQTADRGVSSAAYRKNQEDIGSENESISSRRQLPGMSRQSTEEPSSPPPDYVRSSSPSRASSVRGSTSWSNRVSTTTAHTSLDARSPLPLLDSQKFTPSEASSLTAQTEESGFGRLIAMSPSQGRISPTRPASPTKGMGGFVQSAMLKRSDSVSKRWSAQAPPSLSRQDSIASNRSTAYGGLTGSMSTPKVDTRPSGLSRGNSLEPSSRPTSSHSNATLTHEATEQTAKSPDDIFAKPTRPHHSRAKSVANSTSNPPNSDEKSSEISPPSPSKRWSPTKSSWLESALNKPKSPKFRMAPPPQPSWMTKINEAKQQRMSASREGQADQKEVFPTAKVTKPKFESSSKTMTPTPTSKPVQSNVDAFLRDFDTKEKKDSPSVVGKPLSPSPKAVTPALEEKRESRVSGHQDAPSTTNPVTSPHVPEAIKTEATTSPIESKLDAKRELKIKVELQSKPNPELKSKPEMKPKPDTLPKRDFRSNLKPRQEPALTSQKEELEFRSVFGKLKRTQPQNYKAPDELKDNILRGKSGLTVTGGPKKTERRDELKEDLLKQKEAIKAKVSESGTAAGKKAEPVEALTPEALARRKTLSKADVATPLPPTSTEPLVPRKNARQQPKMQNLEADFTSPLASTSTEYLVPHKNAWQQANFQNSKAGVTSPLPPTSIEPLVTHSDALQQSQMKSRQEVYHPAMSSKLAERFNPALANILARGSLPVTSPPQSPTPPKPKSPSRADPFDKPSASSAELTHMTKARARGPKRRAPGKAATIATSKPTDEIRISSVSLVKDKDILPSSSPKTTAYGQGTQGESVASRRVSGTPSKSLDKPKPSTPAKSPSLKDISTLSPSSDKPKPATPVKSPSLKDISTFSPSDGSEKPKPTAPAKSPLLKGVSMFSTSNNTDKQKPITPIKPSSFKDVSMQDEHEVTSNSPFLTKPFTPKSGIRPLSEKPIQKFDGSTSSPPVRDRLKSTDLREVSKDDKLPSDHDNSASELGNVSVKGAAAMWGRQAPTAGSSVRARSPIKLPTKYDEQTAAENAGLTSSKEHTPDRTVGLGLSRMSAGADLSWKSLGETWPGRSSLPNSPPLSPSPKTVLASEPTAAPEHNIISPEPGTSFNARTTFSSSPAFEISQARDIIFSFFDTHPTFTGPEIDPETLLISKPADTPKIETISSTIREVSGEGKLTPMRSHEEHILYSDIMYLCTHVFTDAQGTKTTEIYFWHGNDVPLHRFEDVQIFARREAVMHGVKLISIEQGKEPSNFFHALRGIVVIRTGPRQDTNRPYMLCARRHMGHIVLDEVDYVLDNLCGGFPYIVCPGPHTNVWLWKGRGAHIEEIAAAKLIASDVSGGEFKETTDGAEPYDWRVNFPPLDSPSLPAQADYWNLKAHTDKYTTRLFRIEQTSRRSTAPTFQVPSFLSSGLNALRRPSFLASSSPFSSPTRTIPPSPSPSRLPPQLDGTTSSRPTTPPPSSPPRTTISEIVPYAYADLTPTSIHILDAYFTLYVLVGPLAHPHSAAFAQALRFAQEYGILAAGVQDRPKVPRGVVVFGGLVREAGFAFRGVVGKGGIGGTEALMAGKRRGREVVVVGVAEAVGVVRGAGV